MRVTNDPDGEIRSRLGVHANVIFYAFALPFAIIPPLVDHMECILLVLTSTACGLGGLGIYRYANHHLPNGRGYPFWIAMAYWINPIVHDANLYDFHITTFISTFIIWMLWAWATGRTITGWVLFTLALLCKEDVAPLLLVLGIGQIVAGNRKTGIKMILVSTIYLLLLFGILIPLTNFGNPVPKVASSRLDWLGETPKDYLITLVTEPLRVLKHLCAPERLRLPFYLLILGGALGIRGGLHIILAILPSIGIAMMTKGDWMTRITGTYYWIPAVALIYISCIFTLKKDASKRFQHLGVAYLLTTSFIACLLFSQTPVGIFSDAKHFQSDKGYIKAMDDLKRLIPDNASVSAQNNIAAHFAKRSMVAIYPSQAETADFVIFHLRYQQGPDALIFPSYSQRHILRNRVDTYFIWVDNYRQSKDWKTVYSNEGFIVFERTLQSKRANLYQDIDWETEKQIFRNSLSPPITNSFRKTVYRLLFYIK